MESISEKDYRVLLADTNEDVLVSVEEFLRDRGPEFEVRLATNTDDAVKAVKEGDVDCVVSGEEVEDGTGIELLREVRATGDTPFVLFLGDLSSERAKEAIEAGATDYVGMTLAEFVAAFEDPGREQPDILANRVVKIVDRERARTSYREIFDKANDAIFVEDPETGEILDVNRRMCEMHGYTRDEALELNVRDVSADNGGFTSEEALENLGVAMEEGSHVFEWKNVTKDGEEFWVEVSLKRATIGGNDRILAIVRDISEQKERERRLKESEEKFRALVEQSLVGIYVVKDGVFDYVNPRFAEIVGEEVEDLVGESPLEYVATEDDRETMRENIRRRESGEVDSIRYSFTAVTADGDEKELEVHGTRIELPDGPAIAGALVDRDEL